MTDKEAREKAEKIQCLSLTLFGVAHTLANVQVAIELLSEEVYSASLLIGQITKDLSPEVREKLKVVTSKSGMRVDEGKDSLVDWIRRVIKEGDGK